METLKELLKKIERFSSNPRIKFLGIFLFAVTLFLEPFLRFWCYQLAKLLNLTTGIFVSGVTEEVLKEVLLNASPVVFLYLPALIFLWVIAKDGYQKLDWILGPTLIAILTKGAIFSLICLKEKNGNFWRLIELGTPEPLIYFFILLFLIVAFWSLIVWIEYLLK